MGVACHKDDSVETCQDPLLLSYVSDNMIDEQARLCHQFLILSGLILMDYLSIPDQLNLVATDIIDFHSTILRNRSDRIKLFLNNIDERINEISNEWKQNFELDFKSSIHAIHSILPHVVLINTRFPTQYQRICNGATLAQSDYCINNYVSLLFDIYSRNLYSVENVHDNKKNTEKSCTTFKKLPMILSMEQMKMFLGGNDDNIYSLNIDKSGGWNTEYRIRVLSRDIHKLDEGLDNLKVLVWQNKIDKYNDEMVQKSKELIVRSVEYVLVPDILNCEHWVICHGFESKSHLTLGKKYGLDSLLIFGVLSVNNVVLFHAYFN